MGNKLHISELATAGTLPGFLRASLLISPIDTHLLLISLLAILALFILR
jgi:hypothetical protein